MITRKSCVVVGLLLAAPGGLAAAGTTGRRRKRRTRVISSFVDDDEFRGLPPDMARLLKKTPEPTLMPTDKPKDKDKNNKKPKKTDPPTYFPTISPQPTPAPMVPTSKPTTLQDFLDSGGVLPPPPTKKPTNSPTASSIPTGIPSQAPSTSEPTGSPTGTPSTDPTSTPSMSPTASAMPSAAPIPYGRSDRVDIRYEPWFDLSDQVRSHAVTLGYSEYTWDNIGTASIEYKDWDALSKNQKESARQLGYDQFGWDCWQNHFQSYKWIEMGKTFIQVLQWWEALGWDIYSWNQYIDAPSSDLRSWYELTPAERDAAAQLCYFRETWDGSDGALLVDGFPIEKPDFRYNLFTSLEREERIVLDEALKYSSLTWNVLGLAEIEKKGWADLSEYEREAASGVGFTQLNWDCWQNHFRSYTWDDLAFYGLDLPYINLGWTSLSWEGVESPPPSQSMSWKELSAKQREGASELCYFRDNWDLLDMTPNQGEFLYPKVKLRYVEWDELPSEVRRIAADSLMYNRTSWNNLGTAEVESRRWDELTEHQKADAMSLGYYYRTWDCFQNHYVSFGWYDLDRDSRDALQALGWSETSWRSGEEPPSYNEWWEGLSEMEQTSAMHVCYFEDSWDMNSLEVVSELTMTEGGSIIEDGFIIEVGTSDFNEEGSYVGSNGGGSTVGLASGGGSSGGNPAGGGFSGSGSSGGISFGGSSGGGPSGGGSTGVGTGVDESAVSGFGSDSGAGTLAGDAGDQVANTAVNQEVGGMTVKPTIKANSAGAFGIHTMTCVVSFVLGASVQIFL